MSELSSNNLIKYIIVILSLKYLHLMLDQFRHFTHLNVFSFITIYGLFSLLLQVLILLLGAAESINLNINLMGTLIDTKLA